MLSDSEMSCRELRLAINDTCVAIEVSTDSPSRKVLTEHLIEMQKIELHRACRLLHSKED